MTTTTRTVELKPFSDQKPGTSGLRKKVSVFRQPHYTEAFLASILLSMPEGAKDAVLVVGGDGRHYSAEVVQLTARIAAAYGVRKLVVGRNGILSTPAASHIIRKRGASGGILLTASHNPGGPDGDFGIKYNLANGGPAPESVTDKIYATSKALRSYLVADDVADVDVDSLGTRRYGGSDGLDVEVISSTADYVAMVRDVFDLGLVGRFLARYPDFGVLFDGLNGVTGPYARAILEDELGLSGATQNCEPLPDFGGLHPDPNLTHARALVDEVERRGVGLGAASDGDGDRNMIYGAGGAFVSPGDSLAIIAHHAGLIPYFDRRGGVRGLARSMPTSRAVDRVAAARGVECFEVPTGWKFFCALFDAGRLGICGEESFGTGSDHIREKDGLWAVMAWLNIMAGIGMAAGRSGPPPSVAEIQADFWREYGRTFFTRHDYEGVDGAGASAVVAAMQATVDRPDVVGSELEDGRVVASAGNFSYTDLDGSVSKGQGLYLSFASGSRLVVRLSGTGASGATVRLYVEQHTSEPAEYARDAQDFLRDEIAFAARFLRLKELIGRDEPDVKT